ncbi:phage baseplate assembly protein V [Vibrio vulnificus]|uniref:phage baseplate assembly protein V n=1 Tax=Vibrio vulnificus TaxID=672 RepID=UPI0019D41502|nr:phage baseplate assembly protein V [Vibrio vulnificus]MBN8090496.1 phage baseplate assembly protein V [Vibrio vulnificus]MBN8119319.1 phage baseplate assembly protein V [Vibrio vulnificus]
MNIAKSLFELIARVEELERNQRNLIRLGRVKEITGTKAVIDYSPGAEDDYLSPPILWIAFEAGDFMRWRAPSIGEQVIVLNLSGGKDEAHALALPAAYCAEFLPSEMDANKTTYSILDVFKVEADKNGNYTLKANGAVSLESGKSFEIKAGDTLSVSAASSASYTSGSETKIQGSRIDLN